MVDWKQIENKWQTRWAEASAFETDPDPDKPKYYLTVAYPYPNSPQHIGHGRTYTLTDVHARHMRMSGYNVLYPMAWHYTGTPLFAMVERLKEKDPALIETFTKLYNIPKRKLKQLETPTAMADYFANEIQTGMKKIGYSIDWRRTFTTVDPYYQQVHRVAVRQAPPEGLHHTGKPPSRLVPTLRQPSRPTRHHRRQGARDRGVHTHQVQEWRHRLPSRHPPPRDRLRRHQHVAKPRRPLRRGRRRRRDVDRQRRGSEEA